MKPSRQVAASYCKDRAATVSVRQKTLPQCLLRFVIVGCFAAPVYMTGSASAAQRVTASHHPDATNVIETYFASTPGYQPGDLITRTQIEKVLAKLKASGFQLKDGDEIAKLGLPDDSFLERELSTTEGRRFMRKIAQQPGTFSRLDRLSTIPRRQATVHDL